MTANRVEVLDASFDEGTPPDRVGWQLSGADASFCVLGLKLQKRYRSWFELESYSVFVRGSRIQPSCFSIPHQGRSVEASVKLKVNSKLQHTVGEGKGLAQTLEIALRKALRPDYPRLDEMSLTSCEAYIKDDDNGSAARVVLYWWDRVHDRGWRSAAVSDDLVSASWLALVDAFDFKKWLDAQDIASSSNAPTIAQV
jgi:2-isopropylmalate synthase